MKGLIIKQPWIAYILDGKKTWEIRGGKTNIGGQIKLIQSGNDLVVGSCELINCKELTLEDCKNNADRHDIQVIDSLSYN